MTKRKISTKKTAKSHPNRLCKECKNPCLEDDNLIINCDNCKEWLHKDCTNINSGEWEFLTTSPNISYSCDTCLENKGKEKSELREIKELLQEHLNETRRSMKNLEDKIYQNVDKIIEEKIGKNSKTQEKLETMINEVKNVEMNIEDKIKLEVKQQLENKKEKESKVNNLIILRLPEQKTNDPTEEFEKDESEVKKIFEKTNPELKAEIEKILKENKIMRLGRKKNDSTKPRPIKVTLPDTDMKRQIFRGCRNLKDSAYQNISVQNDLTAEERQANFKLRQELRDRKEKGEDVCIYRDKIIPVSERPGSKA